MHHAVGHSGFLGGHCAGQHPGKFACYALRNPVMNIAAMAAASDIADWCLEELALPGAFNAPARLAEAGGDAAAEAMDVMYRASPHFHVTKVERPVLLAVGDSDRRVPPFQSEQYYYALQEIGIPVRPPPSPNQLQCKWSPQA